MVTTSTCGPAARAVGERTLPATAKKPRHSSARKAGLSSRMKRLLPEGRRASLSRYWRRAGVVLHADIPTVILYILREGDGSAATPLGGLTQPSRAGYSPMRPAAPRMRARACHPFGAEPDQIGRAHV